MTAERPGGTMTEFLKKRPKTLAFGQLIFIYCWLSNLQKTDSRCFSAN